MPTRYTVQPVAASTAYAQLHTAAIGIEFDRDVSHLNGSFGTKTIHGSIHWYFSFRDVDQRVRQLYVGPDTAEVRAALPAPERYAIHKLLVIGERAGAFKAKAAKDAAQAASLIEFLRDTDPEAVQEAWQDALRRGPGWKRRALEGRRALRTLDSGLAGLLAD